MFRPLLVASLATVAFVGGVAVLAAPGTEVRANTPSTKSDRPEIQLAAHECSQHAWPYYPTAFVTTAARPAKLPMYASSSRARCRT